MIDYLNKKLEALLDSLLAPVWNAVMAASLGAKALVVVIGGAALGSAARPDVPLSLYVETDSVIRVAFSTSNQIPISEDIAEKTRNAIEELSQTVEGELLRENDNNFTPWSAAQTVVAMANTNKMIQNTDAIVSRIRSNAVLDYGCQLVKTADPQCIFISGWAMTAFAYLNVPATPQEIHSLLAAQNEDGWWPTFRVATQLEQYASTYSTAWVLIGLIHQRNKHLIDEQNVLAVNEAIIKARGWLLSKKLGARWKPYPGLRVPIESESISGLVLHALHLSSAPEAIAGLDKEWLDSLPATTPSASDGESNYVEMKKTNPTMVDHFVQIKMPWMLIGTVDAYASGNIFQRAKALNWLERTLNDESAKNAEQSNWWRAELLYGLSYTSARMLGSTEG